MLIIEDGGYAVPLMHEDDDLKSRCNLCYGAVEQTANGIRADRQLLENNILSFPVMNVAESQIKSERESPLVGTAIIQNINRLLEGYGLGLTSMTVGQIGFGVIGEALAEQMNADNVGLTLYDHIKDRRDSAKEKGFSVVDTLEGLMPDKNLIIGCTGEEVVGVNELKLLNKNIYFVNATSKLKELKRQEFIRSTEQVSRRRGIGIEYRLKGGREVLIRLLADGFPVNFFESSESIPDKQIQFIPALLLAATGYLVKNNEERPDIIEIPTELEDKIEELIQQYD